MYKLLMAAFAAMVLSGCASTNSELSDYNKYVSDNYPELNCGVFSNTKVQKLESGYADIVVTDKCVEMMGGAVRFLFVEIQVNEERRASTPETQVCLLAYPPHTDKVLLVDGHVHKKQYMKAANNMLYIECK